MTTATLRAIMPHLDPDAAQTWAYKLGKAMLDGGITTPLRQAAFLAQLAHESGEFRYMEELASGEEYEGRRDLGNVRKGDGKRYKGRGPLQLTGRANYAAAGEALGFDLVGQPQLASQIGVGSLVAVYFWTTRGLNDLADKRQFTAITRRINGGTNGLASRQRYYKKALEVLGA